MTDDRSLERAARSWLELGPTEAPDHAVDAALAQIQTTRQERDLPIPWRLSNMNPIVRLAGVAAVAAVAIGGALYLLDGTGFGPGGRPTPSPTAAPTPTAAPAVPSAIPFTGACLLITGEEAATHAGDVGLGARPIESGSGNVTTCIYSDGGGDVWLRLTYTKAGGGAAFAQVQGAPSAEIVDGVGDQAVFDPDLGTLHVLQGDALLAIVAGNASEGTAIRLTKARTIGLLAVERM
jgi:hypothetical protein